MVEHEKPADPGHAGGQPPRLHLLTPRSITVRLHVLSDLHLEFAPFAPPKVEADAVVLAGDTHLGVRGVEWAAQAFGGRPIIYMPGNHEFYSHAAPDLIARLRTRGAERAVHHSRVGARARIRCASAVRSRCSCGCALASGWV